MKNSGRISFIFSKLEILLAAVMFFVMLVSCGMYIDVKLNGKTSNLPPLSENDTKMLLRTSYSDDVEYSDDLLEPVFIGIKTNDKLSAVLPSVSTRVSVVETIRDSVNELFRGKRKSISFDSDDELYVYIETLKSRSEYAFFAFYNDLPSTVVLPCMLDNFRVDSFQNIFMFKYLFLLSDVDGDLYACAVSNDYEVTELYPEEAIKYDKILNKTYDISDGWSEFEFIEYGSLDPVLLSSFMVADYRVDSFAMLYGKDNMQDWVKDLFDVFSININLVKSFTAGDNSEINHVEEFGELIINDNGEVIFKALDSGGVSLDEYADYISDSEYSTSFSDKIFGLKKIINKLFNQDCGFSFSMTGIDYDDELDSLKIYFKYMADGVFLYNSPYDAVFELKDDTLIYAHFKAVVCAPLSQEQNLVIPQKYASIAANSGAEDMVEIYPVLVDTDMDNVKTVNWAAQDIMPEVIE